MGRTIIPKTRLTGNLSDDVQGQAPDNYASQIVKLIPIEIVGVYLGISNLIADVQVVQWICFFVVLLITPFYLKKVAGITDRAQIIVATISFIIWAFSLGGPFKAWLDGKLPIGFTVEELGGVLIMLYTLVVPIFYRAPKPA